MAYFAVTIENIDTIRPIEGADRIQAATLVGLPFVFVIGKDSFKVGDIVLYFPIDSLIPAPLAEKLRVAGKLAGSDKNRIKTIRLKGIYSQGIVGSFKLLEPWLIQQWGEGWAKKCIEIKPSDITEYFGVTKYEPPAILEKGANLKPLPGGLNVYDIEGIERNQNIIEYMMNKPVRIDEKVEGQNIHFDYIDGKFYVSQRRFTIEPIDGSEHTWWKYAKENNLAHIAKVISERYGANVALYCEGVGPCIQGNYYNFPTHKCIYFDIKVGDVFLDTDEALSIFNEFNLPIAPILAKDVTLQEFIGSSDLTTLSNGKSKLVDKLREGIVIRLMKEENIDRYGRSIIKKRDPIYLAGTDN